METTAASHSRPREWELCFPGGYTEWNSDPKSTVAAWPGSGNTRLDEEPVISNAGSLQGGRGSTAPESEQGDEREGGCKGSTEYMESLVSGLLSDDGQEPSHASIGGTGFTDISSCSPSAEFVRAFDELRMNNVGGWNGGIAAGAGSCESGNQSSVRCVQLMPSTQILPSYGEYEMLNPNDSTVRDSILRSGVIPNGDQVNLSFFSDPQQCSGNAASNGHMMMQKSARDYVAEFELRKTREFEDKMRSARQYAAELQLMKEREAMILRNAQEYAAQALKDKEELQKYKALASGLEGVAERLVIEKQSLYRQNAETMNTCMLLYDHTCGSNIKIAGYQKMISDIMRLSETSHIAQESSMEYPQPIVRAGHVVSKSIGTEFTPPQAASVSSAAYRASATSSNGSTVGSPLAAPSLHGNVIDIPEKKLGIGRRTQNHHSPNRISSLSLPCHDRNSSSRTAPARHPDSETHAQLTTPGTPTSVFAFPSTSPPAAIKTSGNESCAQNTPNNSTDISGVNNEPFTDIFETSKSKRPSADQAALVVQATEINAKTPTVFHDKFATQALAAKGVKSISILLKDKLPAGSNSYKASSCRDKFATNLKSLSPSRRQRLHMSTEKGSQSPTIEQGSVEFQVSNQGQLKTELCNNWQATGYCKYGQQCRFAHGIADLRLVLRHHRYKSEPCRMIMSGQDCHYRHRCHYRHSLTSEEMSLIIEVHGSVKGYASSTQHNPL